MRRRESRTENISGSRSMKTGLDDEDRLDKAASSESGPPDWRVDTVVSKSLPPTFSLIRSLRVILEIKSSILDFGVKTFGGCVNNLG